jgi:UPF0716 protein FxsA
VLVIFGGALLLTPGFLSDALGLVLLLPPTRAIIRGVLVRRYSDRLIASATSGVDARMGRVFTFGTAGRRTRIDDDIVDSTASDVPPRRGERQ